MAEGNDSYGLSLRDLVLEIRADVRSLDEKIDKIDRMGSIGTREELIDHEQRIRGVERWKYGVPPSLLTGVAALVAALFGIRAN